MTSIELDFCIGVTGNMGVVLTRLPDNVHLAQMVVSDFDIVPPGCAKLLANLSSPETVDNRHNFYRLGVNIIGDGAGTSLTGVRVYYHLQVSPAPATATFNDVPTNHPFFAVIEALVAAGVTTGCSTSPPLFCPDGPVTRKQMAAFLARALGLHWAP